MKLCAQRRPPPPSPLPSAGLAAPSVGLAAVLGQLFGNKTSFFLFFQREQTQKLKIICAIKAQCSFSIIPRERL